MFRRHHRPGLSLLEVILAIAILGGSIAVIGELVRLGVRQAEEARTLTAAQLLCESKLEEIAAGAAAAESVGQTVCETDPRFQYSVTVSQLDDQSLLDVRVTVEEVQTARLQPLSFTLVRWMMNPATLATASETTAATTDAMGTTSGSSTTSATQGPTMP